MATSTEARQFANITARAGKSKSGKAVPTSPPKPRAPAVLAHLEASKPALEGLHQQVAVLALEAAEGVEGGRGRLMELHEKIRATQFEIDSNAAAHELALRLDREAYAAWKAAVQALAPEQLIAGLTADDCCARCSVDYGCVITNGGPCGHPSKGGGLPPRLQGDPAIRKIRAAAKEVVLGGIRAKREGAIA